MSTMEKLSIQGLTKIFNKGEFNELVSLRNIELNFKLGEYVLLVGDNGSGKSTLLNAIDGRIRTTEGRINIDRTEVSNLETYQRAKYIYRLFQNSMHGVIPVATIRENMALARNRHSSWSWVKPLESLHEDKLFEEVISAYRPELKDKLDYKIFTLSPGERQAVILALMELQANVEPQILLADEPTASLDPVLASKCASKIRQYAEKGWLCLVVTHDNALINNHEGRIIRLKSGEVICDGVGNNG